MANRTRWAASFLVAMMLPIILAGVGCDQKGVAGGNDPGVTVIDVTVGDGGGTFAVPAGGAGAGIEITIPAGALPANSAVRVRIVAAPGAVDAGYSLITDAVALDFGGVEPAKPVDLVLPVVGNYALADGAAGVRWAAGIGWQAAFISDTAGAPQSESVTLGTDAAGTFAAVGRVGGPESAVSAANFTPATDTLALGTTPAEWCRFGATLLAPFAHARGQAGLNARYDAATAQMVAEQISVRHRFARLGVAEALHAKNQRSGAETLAAIKMAIGATGRPVWLLIAERIPVLAFAVDGDDVHVYNPRAGSPDSVMTFVAGNGTFDYFGTAYTVSPLGTDPRMDAIIAAVLDAFDATADVPVMQTSIGTAGGVMDVASGNLAGCRVEIGTNDLPATTTLSIAEPGWIPPAPRGAEICSPYLKLSGPTDNQFAGQIAVTMAYADPAASVESTLLLGCYSTKNDCWALTRLSSRDTVGNTIRGLTRTAGIFVVFGIPAAQTPVSTANSGTFIYHAWPSGMSEQQVVDHLVQLGIKNLHISALECYGFAAYRVRFPLESGMTAGAGLSHAYTWFDYSTLISAAHAADIKVNFALTIFNNTAPDDPDTPGTHAHHLVETVVPWLLQNCPELDGIMLDYIRYGVGTYTEAQKDVVSKVVARIREKLGAKGRERQHRLWACVWCFTGGNEDGREAVGQRYSDFARDCDVLVPMMYGGNDPYPAADLEWYGRRTQAYVTARNLLDTSAGLMTYGNSTAATIAGHLDATMRAAAMDGFSMYRYDLTSASEWQSVTPYCGP